MSDFRDCSQKEYPVFAEAQVVECGIVDGAAPVGSVYSLKLLVKNGSPLPAAGQFYMLRSSKSQNLLARPVSVFHVEKTSQGGVVTFLILLKGKGTKELCALEGGQLVQALGPLGNTFPKPENGKKVCIIGGGIGVAPVAGFAETLPEKSYDFYASFKSGSYGLENIKACELVITTDDGSVGVHGMLPSAVDASRLKEKGYAAVYACGPAPMLNYVKQISEEAGIQCWLSMESRMACGVGVCLGCVIPTSQGNLRCCKDGPVFDSKILSFPKPNFVRREALKGEPDLSVTIKGVTLQNPLIGSSGAFGYGIEYAEIIDVNRLGGIASKGLTLAPKAGNDGIRIWETPSGLMNSIGLQNPGIPHFIEHELPEMMKFKAKAIANLSGSSLETYVEGAKLLEKTDVPVIELNISCPNVAAGGAAFGMTCDAAGTVVKAVREVTSKPLWVKLTPQSTELNSVALACIEAGADAISLCNSFQGIAIDVETGTFVFDKIKAGFGGPAVRPIAVRLVYELVQAINSLPEDKRVPVIAIGGIATWSDVVEFIMAGASAVEVGTSNFANPLAMLECIDGLKDFMKRKGYSTIEELRGSVKPRN